MKPKHIALSALASILLAGAAYGGTLRFGDWAVAYDGSLLHAGTWNTSDSKLVHTCGEQCVWTLISAPGYTCRVGDPIAIQAATNLGSASLLGECTTSGESGSGWGILIKNAESAGLLKLVAEGRMIRFSIPMTGGHFHIVPFSLNGSTKALQAMYGALSRLNGQSNTPAEEDTTEYDL